MNKTEIIQAVAKATDNTQKNVGEILDAFFDTIGDELAAQNQIQIMGFGKFYSSLVKGREGKNPRDTSETMQIPDTMRVYFSAGQKLKDRANEALKKKSSKKAAPAKKVAKKKKKK
jgi:DNA-binding protein HU-beta